MANLPNNTVRDNKYEIELILQIMKNPHGYGYSNPKGGPEGVIHYCGVELKVSSDNYEAAYVIREILYNAQQGEYKGVMEAKRALI